MTQALLALQSQPVIFLCVPCVYSVCAATVGQPPICLLFSEIPPGLRHLVSHLCTRCVSVPFSLVKRPSCCLVNVIVTFLDSLKSHHDRQKVKRLSGTEGLNPIFVSSVATLPLNYIYNLLHL